MRTVRSAAPEAVAEAKRAGRASASCRRWARFTRGTSRSCGARGRVRVPRGRLIFVNPLQFGPSEDFARYPRRPDEDARVLALHDTDVL